MYSSLYLEVKGISSVYKQTLVLVSNLAEVAQLCYLGFDDGLKRDYTFLKGAFILTFAEHRFKTELVNIHNRTLTNPHYWCQFERSL